MSDNQETLTDAKLFEKLKAIYTEIGLLDEDVKSLKADGKEAELDVALIAKLAKAAADNKLEDLKTKTENTLDLIEKLT